VNYFNDLSDWRQEVYEPCIGITDSENIAYIVRVKNNICKDINDLGDLEILIADRSIHKLRYLILDVDCGYVVRNVWDSHQVLLDYSNNYDEDWSDSPYGICKGSDKQALIYTLWEICRFFEKHSLLFSNLKFLYLRDIKALYLRDTPDRENVNEYFYWEDVEVKESLFRVDDPTRLLSALPNLESIHIYGDFSYSYLNYQGLRHKGLKRLVIDSVRSGLAIEQLFSLDMPKLEYFEIWLDGLLIPEAIVEAMHPILFDNTVPSLKYLSLRNCECVDKLIELVIDAPLMQQVTTIDFKLGNMSDRSIQYILEYPRFNNLKKLNVSNNCLSDIAIRQLKELHFEIEATNQYFSQEERAWINNPKQRLTE
jgi:hypothetical protein